MSAVATQLSSKEAFSKVMIVAGFVLAAAILTPLAVKYPLLVAVGMGAIAVIALAWRKPGLALAAVFACAPWTADVSGGAAAKFSFGEAILVLSLPAFYAHCLARKRRPSLGPAAIPILLYFGVCIYSSAVTWRGQDALISLLQMLLYLVIAVIVFARFTERVEDLFPSLYALVASSTVLSVCAMATKYSCFGQNKNSIGDGLASALLVCAVLLMSNEQMSRRMRSLLIFALVVLTLGLFLSLSRGSWVGTFLGLLMITVLKREYRRLLYICLAIIPIVAVCWSVLPADSKQYATGFGRENGNIDARYDSVEIAKKYFNASPVFGMGVGLRKEYDATNLILLTLAETGWAGLICLTLVYSAFFRMVWQTQRRVHKTERIHSLLCIGAALVLSRLAHGMVDHYWTRGVMMISWGSAGMAVGVYLVSRQRAPVNQLTT